METYHAVGVRAVLAGAVPLVSEHEAFKVGEALQFGAKREGVMVNLQPFVYAHKRVLGRCTIVHAQRTTFRCWFSPSVVWILSYELRLSGFLASVCTP